VGNSGNVAIGNSGNASNNRKIGNVSIVVRLVVVVIWVNSGNMDKPGNVSNCGTIQV